MKKVLFLLLVVLTFASCSEEKVNVRWATFNIRYDNPNDAPNHWDVRKERVVQYIKDMKFDVFGTQEVLHNQFEDLKSMLPGYEGVGVGRDDGATQGEYSAVFYNKNVFDALDSGSFWLSEDPTAVGKMGWDAVCVRIATWAKLQHKATGKIVMAVNTHYDHVGQVAQKESSLLIIRKIKEIVGNQPAVLTGDFNVTDQTEAYRTLVSNEFVLLDAHKVAEKMSGVNYTFHGYAKIAPEKCSKIDFVFVTPNIKVLHSEITQEVKEALLSDHNPQWVDLQF